MSRSIWNLNFSIVLLLLIVYFIFGFFPFNWQLWSPKEFENGAVRSSQQIGFPLPGIAYTRDAPAWLVGVKETTLLRVFLEVQSESRKQYGPARIFTISFDTRLRNLTIGQHGFDLVVRLRSPNTTLNGMPGYLVKDVFREIGWHDVELTVEPKSLSVRVDGEERIRIDLPDNALENWSQDYRLALGNELLGNRAWLGVVRKMIVETADGRVDYLAPNALDVPDTVTTPDNYRQLPRLRLSPVTWNKPVSYFDIRDVIVNFLGFIPFGFFVANLRRARESLYVVGVLCAAVSFSIEFGQIFLNSRITSVSDLILNTLGGVCGAWFSQRVRWYPQD